MARALVVSRDSGDAVGELRPASALIATQTAQLALRANPARKPLRPTYTIRPMIETGAKPPDFTLPDQDGNDVTLSELRGKTVVLYFYPRADTPGCTTQACGIRDRRADYAAAGAVVLGVSPDTVAKVRKFVEKYDLGFTLLADADHAVAERYGVWVQKSRYGRTYWGNSRTTFVIDPTGVIRHVIPKVKPETHDDEVLAAIAA